MLASRSHLFIRLLRWCNLGASAACFFLTCGGDANLWDDTPADLEDEADSERGLDGFQSRKG